MAAAPISSLRSAGRPARRVAALSLGVALALTAVKLAGWRLSGSVGLLASLADSALDVVAAGGVLLAIRYASTPPDAEHRFGHGKAEAFASLLQAALIFTSAALIAVQATTRLIHVQPVRAEPAALGVMVLSTLTAAALAAIQTRVLRTTRSPAVEGDRLHYLADVWTNLIALTGLALAWALHAPRADALGGLLMSAGLVWSGVAMLRSAADNLMDRELDDTERDTILELASDDPQIRYVHDVRTRAAGPLVHIQMQVAMDPAMSLEDAHRILIRAERRILTAFPAADILLHPDPDGRAEPHATLFAKPTIDLTDQERMTRRAAEAREGA